MAKASGIRVVDEMRPRRFRKSLMAGLRSGRYTLRYYGEPGAYKLGIQRGNTIWRILAVEFLKPLNATLKGYSLYKVKPVQYRRRLAA